MMKDCKVVPVWDLDHNNPEQKTEWLALRLDGLGGSDAGAVLGVNKYQSPYSLWSEKTRRSESTEAGSAAKWGKRLEDVVLAAYAEDHNKAVVKWDVILWSNDPDKYFMFASIDGLEVEPSEEFPVGTVTVWRELYPPPGVIGIVESKTSGMDSPGTAYLWDGGAIPMSYEAQTYHYGIVTGIHRIVFAALLPPNGLQVREVEWSEKLAEDLVVIESEFWNNYVLMDFPPPIDGSKATKEAQESRWPASKPEKRVEGGAALAALWPQYVELSRMEKEIEKSKGEVRAKVLEIVGDAEVATVDGVPVLTYKSSADGVAFDKDAFQKAHPDLYAQFLKKTFGSRRLLGKTTPPKARAKK